MLALYVAHLAGSAGLFLSDGSRIPDYDAPSVLANNEALPTPQQFTDVA